MPVTETQARAFGAKHAAEPIPQDGIVVFFNPACPHCQRSLDNTDMKTHTANGAPIKWVDISTPEGIALFQTLKGKENNTIGDTVLGENIPIAVWMKEGAATEVIFQPDPAGRKLEIKRGELDFFAALQNPPAIDKGSRVPKQVSPEPAIAGPGR